MAFGYPYGSSYFNTNYMPPVSQAQAMQAPFGVQQPFTTIPAQQTQQTAQSNVNWVYVNGVQGARDHIVQPGQTAWMMDNNEPVIHVKAVDSMGTATLKSFRLMEITPETQQMAATPSVDMSLYATRAEMEAVSAKVDKLLSEMGGLNV